VKVSQLTVFMENKSGRLAEIMRTLADNAINVRALSSADTSEYGLLRLIVNAPDKAKQVLVSADFTVALTDVVAVEVPDKPGGLAGVIDAFANAGLNIEYMYAFVGTSGENAIVIFRVTPVEQAIEMLKKRGVKLLEGEKVYSL
jgi:hypothetical protein